MAPPPQNESSTDIFVFGLFEAGKNQCGAEQGTYGFPDFTGTPREGVGCEHSTDCELHPPKGLPNADLCCSNDGTCNAAHWNTT